MSSSIRWKSRDEPDGSQLRVAGLATAVGIAGQWLNGLSSSLWLAIALPWTAGLAWEGLAIRRLPMTIERRCRQPLRLGREERGTAHIHNPSGRRLAAVIEMPYPAECQDLTRLDPIRLEPYGRRKLTFPIVARELGELHWPPAYSRVVGPLGLGAWRRKLPATMTATVEPDTLTATTSPWGLGRSGHKRSSQAGSITGELEDLRAYHPGDPLRHIDWKATARRGEPVVKVFAEDQQLDIMIVIDAGRRARLDNGSLSRLGHYVNVGAQMAERAAASGDRVGALLFADQILGQLPRAKAAVKCGASGSC